MASILDNFLTPSEQAWVRAQVQYLQPSQVELQRFQRASDGMGGVIETWSTVATCECRLSPEIAGRTESFLTDKVKDGQYFRLSMPAGTDVRISDRAMVDGKTYRIEGVREPSDVEIERVAYVVPVDD